ncbi:MAG: crotonase/enoyl-CoA hydratase family protein [Rubricella sp.]
MTYNTIALSTDNRGVATLTLNRPEKHNALSAGMIAELTDAADEIARNASIRVVILTGAGESFCAGGDLGWMREQFAADRAGRMAEARKLAAMLGALDTLPKPLIGRVQGQAFGGGIGMMSVCDVVIAADHARFGLTETRLGLIPATISPYVAARMGPKLREVFMSARLFDADEAVRLGLAARTVPANGLDEAIEAEVKPCLAAAPGAVARAKALARGLSSGIDEQVIEQTVTALADAWESPEAQEGITAFFDKRKPGWAGGG